MPDTFCYDVFLSHSSKDRATVRVLAQRLKCVGLRVWYDEWEIGPGDSIPARIDKGLQASRILVLCISASYLESDWGTVEGQTFMFRDPLNRERRFVPLRLDDTELKGSLAQFRALNWGKKNEEHCVAALVEVSTTGSLAADQPGGVARLDPEGGDSMNEYPLEVQGLLQRARRSEAEGEVWQAARRFGKAAVMLEAAGSASEGQIESLRLRESMNETLAAQLRLEYRGQPGPTLVKVFDDNNEFLRSATKLEVHRDGLLHHTALLIARAGNGEAILYRRRPEQTYPGRYDFLGGHTADIDATPFDTALREANEELHLVLNGTRLRIPDAWLHQVGPDHYFECFSPQDRERSTLFVVTLPNHPALRVQLTDEAADGVELLHVSTYETARLADLAADYRSGRKEFASGAERILSAYEGDPEIRTELESWFD